MGAWGNTASGRFDQELDLDGIIKKLYAAVGTTLHQARIEQGHDIAMDGFDISPIAPLVMPAASAVAVLSLSVWRSLSRPAATP